MSNEYSDKKIQQIVEWLEETDEYTIKYSSYVKVTVEDFSSIDDVDDLENALQEGDFTEEFESTTLSSFTTAICCGNTYHNTLDFIEHIDKIHLYVECEDCYEEAMEDSKYCEDCKPTEEEPEEDQVEGDGLEELFGKVGLEAKPTDDTEVFVLVPLTNGLCNTDGCFNYRYGKDKYCSKCNTMHEEQKKRDVEQIVKENEGNADIIEEPNTTDRQECVLCDGMFSTLSKHGACEQCSRRLDNDKEEEHLCNRIRKEQGELSVVILTNEARVRAIEEAEELKKKEPKNNQPLPIINPTNMMTSCKGCGKVMTSSPTAHCMQCETDYRTQFP